jgi:hypothetical protein
VRQQQHHHHENYYDSDDSNYQLSHNGSCTGMAGPGARDYKWSLTVIRNLVNVADASLFEVAAKAMHFWGAKLTGQRLGFSDTKR